MKKMDSELFTAMCKGDSLSLASLRLLVPPLQLMTASMWRVLKKQDVMNYWKVAEVVSLVTDIVPELLIYKHRTQLNLGLRARYIIELCRSEQLDPELVLPYLDKVRSPHSTSVDVEASEAEDVTVNFLELIQTLLKDPEERQDFFMEVFPVEFGSQYDRDLQTLFWEFHCRLTQLLPVPDLEQTVSWLRAESSVLEDCVHSVSEPTGLKDLLQHHKKLGHLEQHVPPSSMGDSILSSLSAVLPSRGSKPVEESNQSDPAQGISEDTHAVTFVDDVAVEIITVTDYAEVELGPSSDIEVVVGENRFEGRDANTVAEDSLVALSEEEDKEEGSGVSGGEDEGTQEKANVLSEVNNVDLTSSQHGTPAGPHDCPDCEKKFKFASSLIAHRVIHTGERPHRCGDCGRCFSFRQSLDRHRHTHKTGRKYDCIVCGKTFHSLSARTVHKQTHMKDCVYTCHQCNKKFNWELSLARHLKTHTDEHSANVPTGPCEDGQDFGMAEANFSEANVELSESDCQAQADDNCGPEGEQDKSSEHPTSQPQGLVSESDNDVTTPGKVRTSGRKRRPTMKIQLINLQKQMMTKSRKEITRATPPPLKPLPFSCAEHSYGSPMISSKDADDSSGADGSLDAFSCPKCTFHHSEEEQVQQHIDEVHSVETNEDRSSLQALADEEGYFSCAACEKSFRFHSLLRAHQRIHTGEQPFSCAQCGRCFSFKQSLERHKQTHTSGRQYECVICGEAFKSLAAQKEHKSTHMENGEYLCSECGRAFAWKSALVRHLKTHSVDADKSEETYKCPRCDLGFSCVSYLNRHLQTHQEERVHACNCGKSFAYRAALTAHQRIHQKERPHTCTQCGKGFLYKGGLLSHMKIHSEEMPFMCSYCGKSFKRERNMKKHERCHTRENVFSCSQCDKSFVYKATLIRHELTHSGERPYLCSDCGKGFFSHAELLKHERFHTGHKPFQCPHCGKKFTQSCYLTIHLRYHTGVRPYSCNECDKSFLSANRLKRHQRTHSGEKPYICGECGKGFRQSYNLKMHQRTHVMKLT